MWKRKELKRGARKALKANYWRCVIVTLLVMTLTGSFGYIREPVQAVEEIANVADVPLDETVESVVDGVASGADPASLLPEGESNTDVVNFVARTFFDHEIPWLDNLVRADRANQGFLATIFNNTTDSRSFIFGVLNAINQMAFQDRVGAGIIIAVGALLSFLYWLLVENVVNVGQQRFFMENSHYPNTNIGQVAYIYQSRRMWRVARIMLGRWLLNALWYLTIVGGVVKSYAWRMVPMLLAENPDLTLRQALRQSSALMKGNKWRAFVLDLSFLGWSLLSMLTFGLLNLLYLTPYRNATETELYLFLRAQALERQPEAAAVMCDTLLAAPPEGLLEYPEELCPVPVAQSRRWLMGDYHRRYALLDYILLFFAFAMIGYIWEVGYWVVTTGDLVNRGTMYGPWLPIYGAGGVVSLFLLKRFADRPVLTFFLSMGLCGVLEYTTAWALETFAHTKWWDYTGYFLNIQGRVCLEGLIVFGLGCCLGIYLLSPTLAGLFDKIPKKVRVTLAVVLCTAFLGDAAYSAMSPNMAAGDAVG